VACGIVEEEVRESVELALELERARREVFAVVMWVGVGGWDDDEEDEDG
jgi:hypothetical protein